MTQQDQERYPAVEVDASIPLLAAPQEESDLLNYIQRLHYWLADNQVTVANAVNDLSYHRVAVANEADEGNTGTASSTDGGTDAQPNAVGSNVFQPVIDRNTGQGRIFVDILDKAGVPTWYEIGGGATGALTGDPTGFENQTDSAISFTDGTRTFRIQPASGEYFYWHLGVRKQVTAAKTVVIPDTEGLWHFYFDSDGVLTAETGLTDPPDYATIKHLLSDNVYIANVYWDATNNKAIFLGDERHGMIMSWIDHGWKHLFAGTQLYIGGTLGSFVVDGSGSSNTHAEYSVSATSILDEDIPIAHSAVSAPAALPVFYRLAGGDWRSGTGPVVTTGTGRAAYNWFNGVSWVLAEVANTDYVLMHVFAINDRTQKHCVVMGQTTYGNLPAAQEGAATELADLITAGLPMQEFVPLGTIIYQTSNSYTNSYKSRVRSTAEGNDYVSWVNESVGPGTAPGDHGSLTGLDHDDHQIYQVADGTVRPWNKITSISAVSKEIMRVYTANLRSNSCIIEYSIECNDGTDVQCETGVITAVAQRANTASVTGGINQEFSRNDATSGTLTVYWAFGTTATYGTLNVRAVTTLTGATLTGYFKVSGCGDQDLTWSI